MTHFQCVVGGSIPPSRTELLSNLNLMKDKVIVVTGASRGLGEVLSQTLTTKGAKVVMVARNEAELQKNAERIGAMAIVADVTKEADLKKVCEETVKKFGRIDIWINNAGIWLPKSPLEEVDMNRAHDLFEVNMFGTAYGSRVALIQMKKQGSGMIVNIVSSAALTGRPQQTIYSASKHAAKGFTDSLREEIKDTNIKVIGIYPGGFKSNLFDEAKPADFDQYMSTEFVAEKILENLEKEIPDPELILKRPGQK